MVDEKYAKGAAYVYGEYAPFQEAKLPIWDMGFLHADVCYDVTSIHGKVTFFVLTIILSVSGKQWKDFI